MPYLSCALIYPAPSLLLRDKGGEKMRERVNVGVLCTVEDAVAYRNHKRETHTEWCAFPTLYLLYLG